MEQPQKQSSTSKGTDFENRVYLSIKRLEELNLATNIKRDYNIIAKDNLKRQIDLSFTLITSVIDIDITIECRSKERNLHIGDTYQIRSYKNDIPIKSLYWMISESNAGDNVIECLKFDGISFYTIEGFERIINSLIRRHSNPNFKRLDGNDIKFTTMNVIQNTNLRLDSQKSNNMMVKNPNNPIFSINQSNNNPFGFDREPFKKAS